MTTKSFRGKLADGAIETVSLHTNTGSTGYKIKKFELMPNQPGAVDGEHVVKIYKIPQYGTPDALVDFSDNTLLGAAFFKTDISEANADSLTVIFDNETFNQDIFVTHQNINGASEVNFYIELEQMKLSLDENTAATLKDIRNIKSNS